MPAYEDVTLAVGICLVSIGLIGLCVTVLFARPRENPKTIREKQRLEEMVQYLRYQVKHGVPLDVAMSNLGYRRSF